MMKFIKYLLIILVLVLISYLYFDYNGPEEILLEKSNLFGFKATHAKDLMIQTSDDSGNIWASRGMIIYKLEKGAAKFKRIAHVPTGFSVFWLRNFSIIRQFTMRPECIEMVASSKGSICAMSAGIIWFKAYNEREFKPTHTLKHYSKKNQGILNNGILQMTDSTLYYGEYFRNEKGKENVCVYESIDFGDSWNIKYTFTPGEIRHIHAVQKDIYSGNAWICTGDNEKNSKIGFTNDNFKTIDIIGTNSEKFTATQLSFTPEYVYWGSDGFNLEDCGIYRWKRSNRELSKLVTVRGCVFFTTVLKNGTLIFTTDREATPFENDLFTRMVVIDKNGKSKVFRCGIWNKRDGFFRQYAKLRMPRQQSNSPYLILSVLKHKGIDDNDLFIIEEDEILKNMN